MYQTLLQIGPITIYSLWVLITIGFLIALVILNKLIQKDRNKLHFIANNSLIILIGGFIMARLFFVIRNFKIFFTREGFSHIWELFYPWENGLSLWGGIFGVTATLIYYCKKQGQNLKEWLDVFTVSIMSGLVFGNIGAFFDGRNYGRETTLPWGVLIESSRYAVPIHPVQIYAAIYIALLTITLLWLFKEKTGKTPGSTALIGVIGYSFLRFLEEFLRGDESNYFLGLREAQIYCLLALVGGSILFYKKMKSDNNKILNPPLE